MVPNVQTVSESFELTPAAVKRDLATARSWTGSEVELLRWLRWRHDWDGTTTVYYLIWLRKALVASSR